MPCECVVGCRCRWLVGISGHTHQCRCLVLGSYAVLSSLPSWSTISVQCLQHPYTMYVASKLGHLLKFPIRGLYDDITFLQVSFHLVFVNVSTFHRFSASQTEALRTSAVSVLGYPACASPVRATHCDMTMCASMLLLSSCSRMRALVIRSCQWTPMRRECVMQQMLV